MTLSILSLLRERLPCSENYWRYRRNFELHKELHSEGSQKEPEVQQKVLAKSHLSFVNNLASYNQGEHIYKPQGSPKNSQNDHPAFDHDAEEDVGPSDEQSDSIQIPVPNFRSNHIAQKLVLFNEKGEVDTKKRTPNDPSSPNRSKSPEVQLQHCICGNPCYEGRTSCEACDGKNSLHLEGEILKKQKKGGVLKTYWFVLLGKELYSYKTKGDVKHKEMKSLSGVYIKDE